MAKKIERIGNYFKMTDTVSGNLEINRSADAIEYDIRKGKIVFIYIKTETLIGGTRKYSYSEFVDLNENPFVDDDELISFLDANTGSLAKNGSVDVTLQDSTSPLMIVKASRIVAETTITSETVVDGYTIDVADATSFAAGQYLTVYNADVNRVFFSNVLSVNVLEVTVDTPIDFAFPVGSLISVGDTNMNVDGSVTPQIFGVRNPTGVDIPLSFDITRLMVSCLTSAAVDLSKFGDIAGGLIRGVVVRRVDGFQNNIFNVKTNAELKGMMFDFDIEAAQGTAQDGFNARMTFAGQNKMGAVIRIGADEDLQVVIQDDLRSLVSFTIIAEGSQVVD